MDLIINSFYVHVDLQIIASWSVVKRWIQISIRPASKTSCQGDMTSSIHVTWIATRLLDAM